ncbi:MAG: SDR family oxidoreductase [Candidatus Dadabacteria bacterium]|nr:MAG: SDR family oxidoreductase [Candidatus Dadabacteria bacterium]
MPVFGGIVFRDITVARIVVTGGAGFIGSHLCDYLIAKGHEVIAVDNLFTGSKSNLAHLFDNDRFEFIRHDVTLPLMLEADEIYHLACPASPVHYQYNPVKTIKTNVIGTLNMLGLAKRLKAKFLLASTSEVYGDPKEHPQKESYWGNVNPIGPRSCYDEGKRVAETLTVNYRESNDVDTVIVRIFNTFGPRMLFNDGRVISNFVLQALQGNPLTIYGDGSQTRSFCYVSDLVKGLVMAMDKEGFHGPVNLGNPDEMSIKDLSEVIIGLVKSSSGVEFLPGLPDDPSRRKPDITLAKKALGWSPAVSLKDGLIKTIEDFSRRLNSAPPP